MAGNWRDKVNGSALGERFWATTSVNRAAVLAAILWAVLVLSYAGGYFAGGGAGHARGTLFLDTVFFLVALVLPLGLIVLTAWLAAELARLRAILGDLVAASAPLAEALAETRTALAQEGPLKPRDLDRSVRYAMADAEATIRRELRQSLEDALAQVREGQRRLEAEMALFARSAPPPPKAAVGDKPPPPREAAPVPGTGAAGGAGALAPADLVRALDFPRDPQDDDGFRALKRAQREPDLAAMLKAAEAVLNLLSQHDVFADDLKPEAASAEAWRSFIEAGHDGDVLDAVAGVRDPRALDTVRHLGETDPNFRDTLHDFQRCFHTVLAAHAADADDSTLVALADTRSGRAFQLGARALPPPETATGRGG